MSWISRVLNFGNGPYGCDSTNKWQNQLSFGQSIHHMRALWDASDFQADQKAPKADQELDAPAGRKWNAGCNAKWSDGSSFSWLGFILPKLKAAFFVIIWAVSPQSVRMTSSIRQSTLYKHLSVTDGRPFFCLSEGECSLFRNSFLAPRQSHIWKYYPYTDFVSSWLFWKL